MSRKVAALSARSGIQQKKELPSYLYKNASPPRNSHALSHKEMLFNVIVDVNLELIRHKGAVPSMSDLMGGQMQAFSNVPIDALSLVDFADIDSKIKRATKLILR